MIPDESPIYLGRPQPAMGFDFVQSPGLVAGRGGQTITFTRASDGTRFNSSGTLVTETTNVARFDYNPSTLAALGLLIEESRTNLCLQSNAFTTTWTALGTPAATQNVVGPDGGTTAWTMTDNNAVTTEGVGQNITLTAAAYTFSIYIKKTSGATIYPVLEALTGTVTANCTVDTNNGIATIWTAYTGRTMLASASATCSNAGSFWRVTMTYTATAAAYTHSIFTAATATATQATGAVDVAQQGSNVFYGAQVELGSFATSYIATTTIAVNRAVDVATINTITPWYNQSEGTLFAEADVFATTTDATTRAVFGFGDPAIAFGSAEAFYLSRDVSSALLFENMLDGGVNQGSTSGGNATANVMFKIAMVYKLNDIAITVNGAVPATDLTATIPTVTTASIGSAAGLWVNGGNHLNGHIKRLNYYNRSLKTQLQQLTA
jgi:hypothetical protein